MQKFLLAASMAALLGACGSPEPAAVTEPDADAGLATEDERILYALGVALGERIADLSLTRQEYERMADGMRDIVLDAPLAVDMDDYGPRIQGFANRRLAAAEKTAAEEFADRIAAEPAAERTASGLVYVPVVAGEGETPSAEDTVRVHYHGTLRDGSVFDSSRDSGEPLSIALSRVIPCWTEGVQKMRVGSTAKLLCPSEIAYGDAGSPPVIPGGAALLFEVELLEIVEQAP